METNAVKKIETVIPTTKVGLQEFAIEINQQIEKGEINPLELLKTFKMIGKLEEMVKEKMMKAAIIEANKYPEKDVELFGVSFKKMEAGTKYDYSNCNDIQYQKIVATEKTIVDERKKREDFLKAIDSSMVIEVVDESTGEVKNDTVYQAVKTSTSTLQVTIK